MSFVKRVFSIDADLVPPLFGIGRHLILDIETTGLDTKEDIIICGGFLDYKTKRAYVYFLPDPLDYPKFRRFLRNTVLWYARNRYAVWAYNADFEKSFLNLPDDVVRDLMVYRVFLRTYYDEEFDEEYDSVDYYLAKMSLVAIDIIKVYYPKIYLGKEDNPVVKKLESYLSDVLKDYISSDRVPEIYYKKWLLRRDKQAIDTIIHHNFVDLFLELWILWYMAQVVYMLQDALKDFALKKFGYLPAEIVRCLHDFF